MLQVDREKTKCSSLSKRPSYTACLNTLKGVYQIRAFSSTLLLSSGLKERPFILGYRLHRSVLPFLKLIIIIGLPDFVQGIFCELPISLRKTFSPEHD